MVVYSETTHEGVHMSYLKISKQNMLDPGAWTLTSVLMEASLARM